MYKREVKTKDELLHSIYAVCDDAIASDQVESTRVGISEKNGKVFVIELSDDEKHTKEVGETYHEIHCDVITAFDEDAFTPFVNTKEVITIVDTIGIFKM